jgi:Ca2+-binding RTX toxin-like protein
VEDVLVALVPARRGRGALGILGLVAVLAAALALPSSALAWTASLDGGKLTLVDATGADDAIALLNDGPSLRVENDAGPGLEGAAPAGCTAASGDLLCPAASVTAVEVHGGAGADTIENDSGVASFSAFGETGDDTLIGGAGIDVLDGGDGSDRLTGGLGDDRLSGGAGDDDLSGGAGDDVIDGGGGRDVIDGGAGGDTLTGGTDADTLVGGAGNDALDGGAGDDVLDGGAGDDVVNGNDGNDLLQSSQGADALHGDAGDDRLVTSGADPLLLDGGEGSDMLRGGDGNDQLLGGAGDDVLDGGAGADVLSGGLGTDTVDYGQRVAAVLVTVGLGSDDGAAGEHDTVEGDLEQVLGGAGDDVLTAGAGAVALRGGLGDDTLRGGPGSDLLDGGAGGDRIFARSASADHDAVRCGDGTDAFAADRGDRIAADCESGRMDGIAISSPGQLARGPSASLAGPTQLIVHVDGRGRLALDIHCQSQTVARCTVRVTVRAMLGHRTLRIAAARLRLAPAATRRLRLRIPARTLRALRRADRAGFTGRVDLAVSDALGRAVSKRTALRVLLPQRAAARAKARGRRS